MPAITPSDVGADWFIGPNAATHMELKMHSAEPTSSTSHILRGDLAFRHMESELRLLSAALITMQEIERKRIATDLHDSIGQSLSTLSVGIGAALDDTRRGDFEMASEMLVKLAIQVKETIIEVQRIAMNLRPATLDDIGVIGTLSWFFREFRTIHSGLALNTDIDIEECEILPALRTNIFRVVQEAMSNIVKHAGASQIRISLRRVDREIHLEVADNGIGFVHEGPDRTPINGSGMGLKGMHDRAEFSGGRFRLVTSPGKGTSVFVTWPLKSETTTT